MEVDFKKNPDGLVPAVVQDATTKNVLMLGYMDEAALAKTQETRKVTFFSRSKQRLWTKGEESGHFLHLVSMTVDCDNDTLLVLANPKGPTCHRGTDTCWNEANEESYGFLSTLEHVISTRIENADSEKSYVASLFAKGINKVAQKVGEEAVELVIESKDSNDDLFLGEAADLLFHYLVLLRVKNYQLKDVLSVLQNRER